MDAGPVSLRRAQRVKRFRAASVYVIGIGFIAAGVAHFLHPDAYQRIVPPWLPAHAALVSVSGAFEILGGAGAMVPVTRRVAGVGLIALLVAVFPANVHMAANPQLYRDVAPAALLYLRLPLQGLAIAWVYATCVGDRS